jgi:hypothetical protein
MVVIDAAYCSPAAIATRTLLLGLDRLTNVKNPGPTVVTTEVKEASVANGDNAGSERSGGNNSTSSGGGGTSSSSSSSSPSISKVDSQGKSNAIARDNVNSHNGKSNDVDIASNDADTADVAAERHRRQRIVRNRWNLYVTLINNPGLRALRHPEPHAFGDHEYLGRWDKLADDDDGDDDDMDGDRKNDTSGDDVVCPKGTGPDTAPSDNLVSVHQRVDSVDSEDTAGQRGPNPDSLGSLGSLPPLPGQIPIK